MLNRHENGESEEYARLRGSIVKACDIAHFNKVMAILKEEAKKSGINIQTALYIWEKSRCADLTTSSGMSEFNRVYNREMSVLD